jgi:predicted Zn finger-like uncharacterized protein
MAAPDGRTKRAFVAAPPIGVIVATVTAYAPQRENHGNPVAKDGVPCVFSLDELSVSKKGFFMIIQCEGCEAKYFLPESKIPPKPRKVRCPQCTAVFTLVPQRQNVVAAAEELVVSSPAASAAPEPRQAAEIAQPAAEPAPPKAKRSKPSKQEREDARAKRLARVLVSDILCYNQEKRDQALIDGNLMAVLGDEIKKSWELYKEKVGPEIAKSTDYFKAALNEILADGKKVF